MTKRENIDSYKRFLQDLKEGFEKGHVLISKKMDLLVEAHKARIIIINQRTTNKLALKWKMEMT